MANLKLLHTAKLFFNDPEVKIRSNLSAIAFSCHKYLWCGTDEYTQIERLTRSDTEPHTFGEHKSYLIQDLISDFDKSAGELDIEGLDYQDGYIWFIGSHSTKRQKAKGDKIEKKALKTVTKEPNRYFLAKIPLNAQSELVTETDCLKIAWLPRYYLVEILANDPYLGSIITSNLPGKDNGFDIEGLAVHNQRVFIGLRGPVLRGIAVLLEIEIEAQEVNQLKLKTISDDGNYYRRHFLDLGGLGIRELCFQGDDLLILAGPTMELDGSIGLYRFKNVLNLPENSLSSLDNQQLELLGEIPHSPQSDRAEGLTLYTENANPSLLVVYDRPTPERLLSSGGVIADVFQI
ncbi:DUF3616 domain-containing protein [Gloeocapsa sp. PCC 73106]|uniref:DUF3616 domain-containing protein n=1 Tax=Gloeocapsa sp. PCC 73106 TaxID=102232 RepID=UPI0002ABF476|nr:DUF3616 domain-containing protein [Gloeocapsa sp. PCC 73106]ELR98579.1 Protein of unknown function (DUF3616) [Gloeocapsa sp. PCC 73106]